MVTIDNRCAACALIVDKLFILFRSDEMGVGISLNVNAGFDGFVYDMVCLLQCKGYFVQCFCIVIIINLSAR